MTRLELQKILQEETDSFDESSRLRDNVLDAMEIAYIKGKKQQCNIDLVSGIFMVEDRGKPLSFHQTKEGAEKAVKDWGESTISGEWNIVPIKTLP